MKIYAFAILTCLLIIDINSKNHLKKSCSPSNIAKKNLIPNLLLQEDFTLGEYILTSPIIRQDLYETWEVHANRFNKKVPYYAHIFRYTLGGTFPIKPEYLTQFCQKVTQFNSQMKQENNNIMALECVKKNYVTANLNGEKVYIILFEKGFQMQKISEICKKHCQKDRVCKYTLRMFSKFMLKVLDCSFSIVDLVFKMKAKFFYYGFFQEKPKPEQPKQYMAIPFLKFNSPSELYTTCGNPPPKCENADRMKDLGIFLQSMYKDPGSEYEYRSYKNYTDVYMQLNKKDCLIKNADPYFGVQKEYNVKLQSYIDKKITDFKEFTTFDQLLKGSFYEFVYKLVKYKKPEDPTANFSSFQEAKSHSFVTSSFELTSTNTLSDSSING